ncbi:MAG: hypothetical protein AB1468_06285 [Candidatus Micrarchaeota archaeon]
MFAEITYYMIFGKPLIMYSGIITLLSFAFTALVMLRNIKGPYSNSLEFHRLMVKLSFALALIHAALGMLAYF